jgi:hypothetical protein
MAKQRVKAIHLIKQFGTRCKAVCDIWCCVVPIEATIIGRKDSYNSKGTFNPTKVTCKRCLKHPNYKEAIDRVKYPLFFLKEGV